MFIPSDATALNELLAQSLGRGWPLSAGDRAHIAAAFRATLKPGQPPHIILPDVQGTDWAAIMDDPEQPLVIVNDVIRAYELCAQGQPAVAILGASRGWIRKWAEDRGASVKERHDLN